MTGLHPYSIDSTERKNVIAVLAMLSIPLGWVFAVLLKGIGLGSVWWVSAPSVMGCFGMLYWVFDKWVWRIALMRRLSIVRVPDLRGPWEGHVISSFDNHGHQHQITVSIIQTWTHISITVQTEHSRSHSVTASIVPSDAHGPMLSYEYLNEPEPAAAETMHAHRGTATLWLKPSGQLEGYYYSGRDRANQGSMRIGRRTRVDGR
jgi:hypothetical protein